MGSDSSRRQRIVADLAAGGPLVYDGSKGVYLSPRLPEVGREASDVAEWLNLLAPHLVQQCHRDYIEAGSQVIQTNTFNGNLFRLEAHGLADRVHEVNLAAAQIAREAAGDGVPVAGSVGPSGKWLVTGEVTSEALKEAFAEQAHALEEGGVDFFHVETMADLGEAVAAVEGIRSVSTLPVALTMSFDTGKPERGLRTMAGLTPTQFAENAGELQLLAIGENCGLGLEGYQAVVTEFLAAGPGHPLIAKVNAGVPRVEAGQVIYDGTPERMAEYAVWCAEHGVALIGGCCGSAPAHIEAMARALAGRLQRS
jgi:5-methyltetrahydrofolate--homocysteine methyltransferase